MKLQQQNRVLPFLNQYGAIVLLAILLTGNCQHHAKGNYDCNKPLCHQIPYHVDADKSLCKRRIPSQ